MMKARSIRRSLLLLPTVFAGVLLAGSAPAAKHPPTVSSDLGIHPKARHTHRVIVQADPLSLDTLLKQLPGNLRKSLRHSLALEVTDRQLEALQRNPLITNISGDLAVASDMAVTNWVTGATSVWAGSVGVPGYDGSGV